jgi:hypothetical protein
MASPPGEPEASSIAATGRFRAPLRRVTATRYITPLREGGSVPALVDADDGRRYVVKLRGAAQGARALVAELVGGEIGRALGLAIPQLAFVELDPALARGEPHGEIQATLRASAGAPPNLGLVHLNGALSFDPAAATPIAGPLASRVVALDAYLTNVDRTARNPNLLWWQGRLAPIDHGASLYWQYDWDGTAAAANPGRAFPLIRDHVLLPWADDLEGAGQALRAAVDDELIDALMDELPDDWLAPLAAAATPAAQKQGYGDWLRARRDAIPALMQEAARARALRV